MISQSCNQCATTKCVPISSDSDSSGGSGSGSDNAGAIAGGVVGGVAFVAILTFLAWWFFIRKRRQQHAEQPGAEKANPAADRQSRKSAHSIASTALTRASNVIQIAYIPGVTNRSPPETPGSLVPPVPPLPGAAPDQHFFMPGDLRDSSWSDMTDSRSVAPSLRSSVATTVYRNNAIVSPMPAQQAMRTRPAVVNINGNNSAGSPQVVHLAAPDAPAVPAITPAQLAKAGVTDADNSNQNSSIVARGMMARPVMVKGASQKSDDIDSTSPAVQTIEEQRETGSSAPASQSGPDTQFDHSKSAFDASSSDDDDSPTAGPGASHDSKQSPFQDQPAAEASGMTSALNRQSVDGGRSAHRHRKSASSGLLMGEALEGSKSNRSSKMLSRVESPFSDANEVK